MVEAGSRAVRGTRDGEEEGAVSRATSMLLALAGGVAISVQARITGSLKVQLQDSVLAAAVVFCSGLVLMILVNLTTRRGRSTVVRMFRGAATKKFPFVFLFTGLLGAYAVFGQSVTVDLLGVAVFSVTFVAGQMVASVVLDTLGWSPAGKKQLAPLRLLGAVLALAGVVLALAPRLGADASVAAMSLQALAVPLLVVFTGGLLQPAQMVMNGVVQNHVGRPEPLVLTNYLTGTIALTLFSIPAIADGALGRLPATPADWWFYTGGLLGSIVVMGGAILTRTIGALLFTLGIVAGQLVGALFLDLFWPAPGSVVVWQTVFGVAVTMLALLLASASGLRAAVRPDVAPSRVERR